MLSIVSEQMIAIKITNTRFTGMAKLVCSEVVDSIIRGLLMKFNSSEKYDGLFFSLRTY